MNTVAIIPARGGSKGIKNKNLQKINGISLIGRAVRVANQSGEIDEVFVSTDSIEIAEEAKRFGASVIQRPAELSADDSSSESAILHALGFVEFADIIVFIQCTSPFLVAEDLDSAILLIKSKKYDSVFASVEDHGFRWKSDSESMSPVGHEIGHRPRRQDLPRMYLETGAFYVFGRKTFIESGSRFHGRIGHVSQEKFFSLDIDSEEDLQAARNISSYFKEPKQDQDIKTVVLDFDGVQTDDYAWIGSDGTEYVKVSRSDGYGVSMIQAHGIEVLILSSETNPVVGKRAQKLGAQVIQGAKNKAELLSEWLEGKGLKLSEVAYLGNDINDLDVMKMVGLPVAVADAHPQIKKTSKIVLSAKGGEKAVRELADLLLTSL